MPIISAGTVSQTFTSVVIVQAPSVCPPRGAAVSRQTLALAYDATGAASGVDTASVAPGATATGGALTNAAGVTATASAPAASAGVSVTGSAAGSTATASAPASSAIGAASASAAGVTANATVPSLSAA